MFTELGILNLIKRARDRPWTPAVTMLGLKAGDRVVVAGAAKPDLVGAIGAMTGLNGQTTVVDADEGAQTRVARAAAAAGALVEFVRAPLAMLPLQSQTFDVAILPVGLAALGSQAPVVLAEAIRVVRPGGRISLCEPVPRQGLFSLAQRIPPVDPQTIIARLTAAGLRAARHLGNLDGTAYFEAARARQ
jgi:ubiquinone/menaquinone biosynthesis C-methylase UbiE